MTGTTTDGEPGGGPGAPDAPSRSVSRPMRRDAERNRQRVLDAAAELFAAQGLAARMDEIAQRAGVGVGTLYRRFPDKEALVEALFEARIGDVIELADRALAMPSGWDALVHYLHEASSMLAGDRGLREIALSTGYGRSRVAPLRTEVDVRLKQLVARAKAEGALREEITSTDVPLLLFMVGEVAQNSHGVHPGLGRRYLDLLIDGMRPHPGRSHLDEAMDDEQLARFMQGWGPAPR